MAAELEELLVQLKADADQFKAEMKSSRVDFQKSMDGMTAAVNEFSKKSEGGFRLSTLAVGSFIGSFAATAATKALSAIADGVSAVSHLILNEGVAAATEEEATLNRLANAFTMAGQAAGEGVTQFSEFADEIQKTTGFEGDAVLATGALIESMASLTEDGLEKATQAAIDLAAATGKDLAEVTVAVAKAADGQVSGLARLGIKIQETGDRAFDAANAMRILEERFGGSAARMKNFETVTAQAKNAFDDIIKEFAKGITQNPVLLATIEAVTQQFYLFEAAIKENIGGIKQFIGGGIVLAIDVLGGFISAMQATIQVGYALFSLMTISHKVVLHLAEAFAELASGSVVGAGKAFERIGEDFTNLVGAFQGEGAPLEGFFDTLQTSLGDVKGAAGRAFDNAAANGFADAVKKGGDAAGYAAQKLTLAQEEAIKFGQALAKKGTDPTQEFNDQTATLKAQKDAELITEQEYFQAKQDLLAANLQAEQDQLNTAIAAKGLSEQQARSAQLQLDQEQNNKRLALQAEVNKAREANMKGSLGIISSLQSAHSKELVEVGKAAGTAQAIIDGQVAIQKAWAVGGPFGAVLAAGVAAATAVQIAKIQGIALAGGIDTVPGTGNGDTVPAMLTPGERVVPKNTNQDLKEFLAMQNNEPKTVINNTFHVSGIESVDDLIRKLNDAVARGSLRFLPA